MIILRFTRFASYTSLAFSPQTSTAGARGSQWGWDDEDEDMGGLDAPEIEYKVSDRTCPNSLASQMMINLHRRRRFTIALLLRKKLNFWSLKESLYSLIWITTFVYFHQLTTCVEQRKKLQFLKSVVAPLVESYWVSACGLLWLRNQRFSGIVELISYFLVWLLKYSCRFEWRL